MKRPLTLGERLRRADWFLLGMGVLLALFGVLIVSVASQGQRVDYAWGQLRWTVIGTAVCLLMLAIPYRSVVMWRYVLYAGGIALLLLVLVVGRGGKTANRWLQLGSFHMQPSELMKVILVIMLAGFIRYQETHKTFRGLAWPFALTLVPMLLIMKQPDLGTALLLIPTLFVMLWVAGARARHLFTVAGAGLAAAVLLFFTPGVLKEYQKDRVRAFLLQDSQDKSLIQGHNHQLHHSKIVVANASVVGAGFGDDAFEQVRYLPERHSDFIFPVLVATMGHMGVVILYGCYALFVLLVLRTAMRVREPSGRLLAVGVATLLCFQALINMGMTVGLFPIVGTPLPFLSAGGSSLLTFFIALGLVLNVGADSPVEFGRGDFD
ncbi:MAG: FtsW/RodA/SpoVE family cell cycle protein [Planctomycetota bacterium]|nr:FtsW/RodA/SpoVE family cell cycle protein [Planctomycetota bacterium]